MTVQDEGTGMYNNKKKVFEMCAKVFGTVPKNESFKFFFG